jgi:AmmeMemoRadiSam system protein B
MSAAVPGTVRHSRFAGSWYPGDAQDLKRTVEDYIARVDQPLLPDRPLGLISPHAGYVYSGQTAAYAYRQLEGRSVSTVVILAPSHRAWFDPPAVSMEAAYETPLGRVPIDRDWVEALSARIPLQPIRGDREHALEIQLPFLQVMLGSFRLVPLLVSADDPDKARQLAHALSETASQAPGAGRDLLLVASSDMHHIPDYDEVLRRDEPVVDAVAAYDLPALTRLLMDRHCSVCGRIPILVVLEACKLLGADFVRVLHHTTSGDVTGERRAGEYTVGYMAAAVFQRTSPSLPPGQPDAADAGPA